MIEITELLAAAVQYTPMTDIPFLPSWGEGGEFSGSTEDVFNALFKLSMVIGAMLAVFMFIWGGLQMITARDSAGSVGKGKEKMTNAVMGLLMLLATFVVLNTINPQLTNLTLFGGANGEGLTKLSAPPRSASAPSTQENYYIADRSSAPDTTGAQSTGNFCYSYGGQNYCYQTNSECGGKAVIGGLTCQDYRAGQDAGQLANLESQERQYGCLRNQNSGTTQPCQTIYSDVAICRERNPASSNCGSQPFRRGTPTDDGPFYVDTPGGAQPGLMFATEDYCALYAKLSNLSTGCKRL